MIKKECVLYDNKICDECGDCNFCDINPDKICDNCGKCIEGYDYSEVEITSIIEESEHDDTDADVHSDKCCSPGHHHHDGCNCRH